jgi:hypothetical protein
MKERKFIHDFNLFSVFSDRDNEKCFYALTIENEKKMYSMINEYEGDINSIPDEIALEAYKVEKAKEDKSYELYDVDKSSKLFFQVNKIVLLGLKESGD